MSTFIELCQQKAEQINRHVVNGEPYDSKKLATGIELMSNFMKTDGSYRGPRIEMTEALQSADASILFPKVISDVLLRPKEPLMIGQTLLSRTIQIDNVRSIEFPTMGALRAFEIGEGQPYHEQFPSFAEHMVELKVKKHGLTVGVTEEIIKNSMWDMLSILVESAGYAMLRLKEEKIFNEFTDKGHAVFNNLLTTPAAWTNGRGSDQVRNYSVTFDDLIDSMGALVSHEYVPTDFVMHPLAWVIFAKDPILRSVMLTQGQIGNSVWSSKPDFNQQHNMPWNVQYQVSPFIPMTLNGTLATGPASGLGACNITDIYVIDRQNSCVVLQREPMEVDEFDDPLRDIKQMKIREYYDVKTINGGRATCVLKNARLVQNFAPQLAVYSVTPA